MTEEKNLSSSFQKTLVKAFLDVCGRQQVGLDTAAHFSCSLHRDPGHAT
jgi:hypothetical protein